MSTVVIDGCHIATVDAERSEYTSGHVVVEGNRIVAVGDGPGPRGIADARHVDGSGCLLTPGLVNTHHHLYQWVTRGYAVDGSLFEWLTTLYPVWGKIDEDVVRTAATGALGWLARTGCTTSTDHHYVFPHDGGDVLGAEIEAARTVGLRFHPTRGSMDLGVSQGGLPPDNVVEDIDTILAATELRHRHPPRHVVRLDAADRGRPVLAVLGHRRSAAAGRRAGPREGCAAAHPPLRDARRGGLLPRALQRHPGRVHGVAGLARA